VMDEELLATFTEAIAWKCFDGFFPHASNETIARAVLSAMPLFRDAPVEVRRCFLAHFMAMVMSRKLLQHDARIADTSSEWKA
jgi:hypothetical protein